MSKNNMLLGYARGKVGDLVFSRRLGQQVAKAYNPSPSNPRTEAQMAQRTKLSALINAYRCMRVILDHSFTNRKEGQTSYNVFMSANMRISPYLTKEQAAQGVVVVLPYVVSRGVLSRIYVSGSGDDAYTNISLGSLEINDDTTIAEFTQAVVQNNANWKEGDQLTYVSVIQTALPGQTEFPHASAQEFKITLDSANQETLRTYLPDYASATINGYLGHGTHYNSGGFAWIHSRKDAQGALQVSTQELICNIDNSRWQSTEQEDAAKRSYGFNSEPYLTPGEDDSSPVNIDLQVIEASLQPASQLLPEQATFRLDKLTQVNYLPVGATPGEPFTISFFLYGNNLGLLNEESLKWQYNAYPNQSGNWSEAYNIATIEVAGGITASGTFEHTFPTEAAVGFSGFRLLYNNKIIFEWTH